MSLIGIGIAAAVAAVAAAGGAALARRRRRSLKALATAGPTADAAAANTAVATANAAMAPPLAVGDVVQVGMRARWSQGGLLAHDHEGVRLVVLFSQDGATREATVAFAPPERAILWLNPHDTPPQLPAPSRIEIERQLLERTMLLSVSIRHEGDAPAISGDATIAVYQGAVGEAAVILDHPSLPMLWYGERIAAEDWERLANVPD